MDHRDGKNDNYRLMLVKENTNILLHKSKKLTFEKKDFKQYCYCFTVPSGMLVLRKNNNIF